MGYFSLDIKKAKGSSDTVQSDHIERRIIPKNADPTRTHLNRVLIEYPDGVHGRDEAIAHKLNTAGIKRKITHDQVRVVRVVLSGTHEAYRKTEDLTNGAATASNGCKPHSAGRTWLPPIFTWTRRHRISMQPLFPS